jgi:hypothetical protein
LRIILANASILKDNPEKAEINPGGEEGKKP